jgi:hypothetical protein
VDSCCFWNNKAFFVCFCHFCSTGGIIAAFLALLWLYVAFLMLFYGYVRVSCCSPNGGNKTMNIVIASVSEAIH